MLKTPLGLIKTVCNEEALQADTIAYNRSCPELKPRRYIMRFQRDGKGKIMSTLKNISLGMILHRIRVRLYPNYLNSVKGAYIAKTNNQRALSIEDICTAMKTRGDFTGNYDVLVDYVRQYNDEVAYQLCDGYSVSNSYYTVYPNIGGCFNTANEEYDKKNHPISFRFTTMKKLRDLINYIAVEVEGIANVAGYIDTYTDNEENSVNGLYVPGNMFSIRGHKIKLAGESASVGVYFVPADDSSKAVKVTRIAENNPSKIIGIAPSTGYLQNKIEVRTHFSTSKVLLKTMKTITSDFLLEEA